VALTLPKSLLDLDEADRNAILAVVKEAMKRPKVKTVPVAGDEHHLWAPNSDPLLAELEDALYLRLIDFEAERIAQLFLLFDLPTDGLSVEKSFGSDYLQYEADRLLKAKDSGRNRLSQFIDGIKAKAKKKIFEWVQNGRPLPMNQLEQLDRTLSQKLPDYAQLAEDFAIRAGFIGKARRVADIEDLNIIGAVIDRFPSTIQASRKEGIVLTYREGANEAKKTKKTVRIAPLTPLEADAVRHASWSAGDKITEISEKHRRAVRQLVMRAKRERWSAPQLAERLFDTFGDHNRDWRRVAITELAFAHNDAFLAGLEDGATIVGMGAINACKHCKDHVIGKTFTYTTKVPEKENYHTDTKLVWLGKSNYGRRVSEYRPALPLHPNCRCRWHVLSRFYKVGPNGTFELKSTAELIQEERIRRGLPPDPSLEGANGLLTQEELAKRSEAVLRKLSS